LCSSSAYTSKIAFKDEMRVSALAKLEDADEIPAHKLCSPSSSSDPVSSSPRRLLSPTILSTDFNSVFTTALLNNLQPPDKSSAKMHLRSRIGYFVISNTLLLSLKIGRRIVEFTQLTKHLQLTCSYHTQARPQVLYTMEPR
jgi:hypothetical protein